jgi:predicted nucleic acid-binding protein
MIRVVLDTNVLVSALISPFGNEAQALDASG